jgi:UDP-N-acetylglucosamine--N-acetylmuramyl-(pentapeptide) pyrophosphoryl-undecaprenol N-acetylglucosamine transferase
LPVAIAAWLCRVPLVIHEQTAAVGLANAVAGKIATRVGVTFAESRTYFDAAKVSVTGNPMQPVILAPDISRFQSTEFGQWLSADGPPLVYVTGGGLGSHKMNVAVEEVLPDLLRSYRLVHQCGSHAGFADFARLTSAAAALPQELADRYRPFEHIAPEDIGLIYKTAALVVARSGANTVLELAAHGLPAVLIPIPWVTHDEQTKNATVLVEAGTAVLLPERNLSGSTLAAAIASQVLPSAVNEASRQRARELVDPEATAKLVSLILEAGHGRT